MILAVTLFQAAYGQLRIELILSISSWTNPRIISMLKSMFEGALNKSTFAHFHIS